MKNGREIAVQTPKVPQKIPNDIRAVEINIESIAKMKPTEWDAALHDFKKEVDGITSVSNLRVFERDIQRFLEEHRPENYSPRLAGAKTIRRLLGVIGSTIATTGESVVSGHYTGWTASLLAGFAALLAKDVRTSYKTHTFVFSETGTARMNELAQILRDVIRRVEMQTPPTIAGEAVEIS